MEQAEMRRTEKTEGPITSATRKIARRDEIHVWSGPILANMLWVLLSIFLITMPLALVGLIGFIYRWMTDRDTRVFAIFFGTIRQTWIKCYLLFALDIAVGALIYFNFLMFQIMDMTDVLAFLSRSLTVMVLAFLVLFNVHAWVLIAIWDAPFKHIMDFTLRLIFAQPIWSLLFSMAIIFFVVLTLNMPAMVLVMVTGAIAAYIASWGTQFLVRKYLTEEQFSIIEIR